MLVIFHFLKSDVANSQPKENTEKPYLTEKKRKKKYGAV